MKHKFKVGDHVEWNSEAGPCPRNDPKKGYLDDEVQDLHGPRLEGGAAIFNQERQDRPHGHAQRCGSEKTQPKETGQPALKTIIRRSMLCRYTKLN